MSLLVGSRTCWVGEWQICLLFLPTDSVVCDRAGFCSRTPLIMHFGVLGIPIFVFVLRIVCCLGYYCYLSNLFQFIIHHLFCHWCHMFWGTDSCLGFCVQYAIKIWSIILVYIGSRLWKMIVLIVRWYIPSSSSKYFYTRCKST